MPTKSQTVAPLGVQVPRLHHAPSVRANAWEDVADVAKAYGLVLDEWQENALEASMGERADGQWATPRVGISVPRQNGKGALIEARELAGLLVFGEQSIVHSAHEQQTARVGFERIKSYFENYDDLRRKVKNVISALGRESITLTTGQVLRFPARSKGAIRGFSIDCLLLDEAQILGEKAWAAILPTMSARPNPQVWLLGTPPTPADDGEVFERFRAGGVNGSDRRLCWQEWSAESGSDLDDRAAWRQANPALGVRIGYETVADERHAFDDSTFARERLGMWDEVAAHKRVIPAEVWQALEAGAEAPAPNAVPAALAVDMSHDRAASVAACWAVGERWHVEVVHSSHDTASVVEWLALTAGKRIPVVIDGMSPAASMIATLKARRVRVVPPTNAGDMAKACGGFYDDAVGARLTHAGQDVLSDALAGAQKRRIGDAGGWGWDRKDPTVNIAPLVAATLARFGAVVTKKAKSSTTTERRAVVL